MAGAGVFVGLAAGNASVSPLSIKCPVAAVVKTTRKPQLPSLEESRATVLEFGRFHGWTLGDVADREATYIDWIARTITRDRDLVVRARLIAADLDERGIERSVRPPRPGFGDARDEREAAEASA